MISIKVPCSTANLGPGFDVLGLALSLYLELQVTFTSTSSSDAHLNCEITCAGLGAENLRTNPEENLITQVALYVLRCHNQHEFPCLTKLHIINGIPLSRGLGSSGAAVVAGAMLANEVGRLGLGKDRILDFCLMVERHPDNITAALYGGFIGACLSELDPEDAARVEVPLAEVLPEPAGGVDTGKRPPVPPLGIGQFERFRLSSDIKAVVVIPNFKVDTAKAREVLPNQYSRQDLVCLNLWCALTRSSLRLYRFTRRSELPSSRKYWVNLPRIRRKSIWPCRIECISLIAQTLYPVCPRLLKR